MLVHLLTVELKPYRFIRFESLHVLYSSSVILLFYVPGTWTVLLRLLVKFFGASAASILFSFLAQVLSSLVSKFLYSATASCLFKVPSIAFLIELALRDASLAAILVLSASFSTLTHHLAFLAYFSSIFFSQFYWRGEAGSSSSLSSALIALGKRT